jgi:hypothetical protein
MKTMMAVIMLVMSTSVLADKPVCYEGSTFPACVNANQTPEGLAANLTENNVHSVPEPSTLALIGVGAAAFGIAGVIRRKGRI